jgi:hypothetical protein
VEELLLSVIECHSARGVRQIEIYTADPLVRGFSPSEVETAIVKLKKV